MFKLPSRFFCVLLVFSSVGCTSVATRNAMIQTQWQGDLVSGLFTTKDKPLLQEHHGEMYQIRYSAEDTLVSHRFQTGKDTQITPVPVGAHLTGVSSYSDDKNLYAAWRFKLAADSKDGAGKNGDKMVYVAHSADGEGFAPATRISSGNGAFLPILAGNKLGDVYAIWQDERSGANYDLYFNVSHDHGATWKPRDMRLDIGKEGESFSAEPFMRAEGNWLWLTWVEAGVEGCAVYSRASDDRGETWRDAVEVAKCGSNQALFPQLVRSKNQLIAYWFDSKTVKSSVSTNNGATWGPAATIAEVGTEGVSMQELTVKEDANGTVHLIYGKKGEAKGARSNLYYARAENGVEFAAPVRLNSGVEYQDSAILSAIALDGQQNVMVSWTDYRYFRPVTVGAYSADQGKTWSRDFLMGGEPGKDTSQFSHVSATATQWWVSMVNYAGVNADQMKQGKALVNTINPAATGPSLDQYDAADQTKLEPRVKAWWKTRVAADWAGSYEFMDPFMKTKNSKAAYVASQGMVKYYGYEFVGFEMTSDRQATVKVKYTSEVPEMEINGKKYEIPKKEVEISQEWMFVDGNWYLVFRDLFGNTFREL